ncbi:hypothetical protein HUT18_03495 [Streptomyces sp. NA04227]|uniref:hypothetical protein n=1 Tax=Streptomyces sp. NA04227 TaxID=2742136 RepID=UPI001592745E|nr:hypothetical protein [Streptomyces sp. NA04227]QKW05577.1 hypothetical protein HUT18_03495 [Streptomyces sp. NA04227]
MSSPTEPAPGHDTAPDIPEAPPAPHDSNTPPEASTDPQADPGHLVAELRKRIAELEQDKADQEREDLIQDLARRYHYMTPDVLRSFGDLPTAELEERAHLLNNAIHERTTGPAPGHIPLGRGGLSPNGKPRSVTWAGAFQRAREQRRTGRGGVTYFSDGRSSGEL